MELCFYNMNHIGDIYFMYLFLNKICSQNDNINFLFYTINCDIFFKNIKNIHRLYNIETHYSDKLINGTPPENLLDKTILNILKNNKMEKTGFKVINIDGRNILFVNTWCVSNLLNHNEFDIHSAIYAYTNLISTINKNFNLSLKLNIKNPIELIENLTDEENKDNFNNEEYEKYKETIFIFNFVPRSLSYDMNILNSLIQNLSIDNNIILSNYNSLFDNNKNIRFIDRDYKIYPVPSCENLLDIWDIAIKCKNIILLPSGGCWTFLHKLKYIKKNQLYMFNNKNYCKIINDFINVLLGEPKDLLNLYNYN